MEEKGAITVHWIREMIRQVVKKLFGKNKMEQVTGVEIAISDKMENSINLWSRYYRGYMPYLYRPDGTRDDTVKTMHLPSAIASKVAKMVTLEMDMAVSGSPRADYINEQCAPVLETIRQTVEFACAKGGLVFKPYVQGGQIETDLVQGDKFFPTAFNSRGEVTGAIFVETLTRGDRYFTRLEYHNFDGNVVEIKNRAFVSKDENSLGDEIELSSVEEWKEIDADINIANMKKPLFAYFKMPFANTVDEGSPIGVSIYARALNLIEEADLQWSRILWEYEGGELAIDADIAALKGNSTDGVALPKRKERLFRSVNIDGGNGKDFYSVFSPVLRDPSLFNGLNKIFQRIEFACGLAYGTISDPQAIDKTATEIKASKQDSYATVTDIQTALQKSLNDLTYCMDALATLYKLAPSGRYEASYKWDDSIVVDAETERAKDKEDVRDKIMPPWEFRMKWYGEDKETAKRMISEAVGSTDDKGWFEEE